MPDKQHLDFKRKTSVDSSSFKNRNLLDLIFNRDKTSVCYPQERNIQTGKFAIKSESEVSIDDYWSSFPDKFILICRQFGLQKFEFSESICLRNLHNFQPFQTELIDEFNDPKEPYAYEQCLGNITYELQRHFYVLKFISDA